MNVPRSDKTAAATGTRAAAAPGPSPADSEAILCEVAWEVCQQLGGIYTVIRSKVPRMVRRWAARYVLVGPYHPDTAAVEFEESVPSEPVAAAVAAMRAQGYEVHCGTWLIVGRPQTVLVDPRCVRGRLGEIKYGLWDRHRISLPGQDGLIDDVVAFGYLVEQFLRALAAAAGPGRPVIGHFHEWMAGSAIPGLRRSGPPMALVFTTHATQVGRCMAANEPGFYDRLPTADWLESARRYGVEPKAQLERAAAHGAHVFTTVSEITAFECEHLLGRKPDVLLPNGLNIERFVAMHEFQNLHREYKEQIHQFVMAHFFPSYTFDLDRTLYVFTAGRYEYRNKGYDLVIRAMARLNSEMKRAGVDRTVVLFIVTQRPFRSMNADVLRSRAVMEEMRHNCDQIKRQFGERLFAATVMGERPKFETLVDEVRILRLRRVAQAWKARRMPLLVTHDLADEGGDEVLREVHASMLFNSADDRVKVVYHPDFITSSNPLFGMDYDQFVRGCHLGLFPSFYEPWGYTPMECVALGVPAVTSDLSGFGTYLLEHVPDYADRGLTVIGRRRASDEAAVAEMTRGLMTFLAMERRERIAQRNQVESLAEGFDWEHLGRYYTEAHRLALERAGIR
ncbi:MAG: glycogen synthase [Planctomycetes bacterium]|nr:glycogen synthase [Planctomycetota bacterium]